MATRSQSKRMQSFALKQKTFAKHFLIRLAGGNEARTSQDSLSDIQEEAEEESVQKKLNKRSKVLGKLLKYTQLLVLAICWLTFTVFLMANKEFEYEKGSLTVPAGKEGLKVSINNDEPDLSLCLQLYGAFVKNTFRFDTIYTSQLEKPNLVVNLLFLKPDNSVETLETVVQVYLSEEEKLEMVESIVERPRLAEGKYQLHFFSNLNESLPLQMSYEFIMMSQKTGLILGSILLILIYMALIFELVHRTVAGVVCSTLAIGLISAVHLRPSQSIIFNEWGNIDTVLLFFGASITIELMAETGLQDYLAALSYEFAHGHIWPMLNCMFLVSCLLSNVIDEILLVLFIAPICLRLCEIMQLNCTPVLSALIIAINVGSTLTPISSLSNNLIVNSPFLVKDHVAIGTFMIHMLPATLLTLAQSYIQFRLQFYNSEKMRIYEPFPVRRLKRLIKVWRKASSKMGDYTWDESLARQTVDRRIISLYKRLKRLGKMPSRPSGFEERVQNLRQNYPIRRPYLITVCLIALFITLIFSLFSRIPSMLKISKGWIAILAALFVLSMTCYEDIEGLLSRIDWSTMLFFVTLSILTHVLIILGLLDKIGLIMEHLIITVDESHRLTVAILLIIWISSLLATFIDNVPVADMMMRIIATLSLNQNINMPIMPLVWSLALGCTLGGNGSIVGAVANIACAGVASRHGYKLSFFGYFKIGFFIMLGNVLVASCYLLLVHVGFQWH